MSTHERNESVDQDTCRSLTDDEIVTERRLSRRSFVAAAGVFLTGGAMALLTDRQALAQVADPNRPAPTDPDSKPADPDGKKHKHHHRHHHHHAPPPSDPTAPAPPPDPH